VVVATRDAVSRAFSVVANDLAGLGVSNVYATHHASPVAASEPPTGPTWLDRVWWGVSDVEGGQPDDQRRAASAVARLHSMAVQDGFAPALALLAELRLVGRRRVLPWHVFDSLPPMPMNASAYPRTAPPRRCWSVVSPWSTAASERVTLRLRTTSDALVAWAFASCLVEHELQGFAAWVARQPGVAADPRSRTRDSDSGEAHEYEFQVTEDGTVRVFAPHMASAGRQDEDDEGNGEGEEEEAGGGATGSAATVGEWQPHRTATPAYCPQAVVPGDGVTAAEAEANHAACLAAVRGATMVQLSSPLMLHAMGLPAPVVIAHSDIMRLATIHPGSSAYEEDDEAGQDGEDDMPDSTSWLVSGPGSGEDYVGGPWGYAIRSDAVRTPYPRLLALTLAHSMASLGLLHLGRVGVHTAAVGRAFPDGCHQAGGVCAEWDAAERDQLLAVQARAAAARRPHALRALDAAVDHVEAGLAALTGWAWLAAPEDAVPVPGGRVVAMNGTFALFSADRDAVAVVAKAARRGSDAAAMAVASWVMQGVDVPGFDTAGAVDAQSRCMQAADVVLPLAQRATASSSAAVLLDGGFAPLWEVHEDAVVTAAVTEEEHQVQWVRELAAEGDGEAQMQMGEMLMHGVPHAGLPPDLPAARNFLQQAVDAGVPGARVRLAMVMLDMQHQHDNAIRPATERINTTHAVAMLLEEAATGSIDALAALGYVYQTGNGAPRNLTKAVEYLKQAADGGAVAAYSNLGALYLQSGIEGEGQEDTVPFNATAARHYFRLAAEMGSAPAEFNLGLIDYYGWADGGGEPNCTAAMEPWMKLAMGGGWDAASTISHATAFEHARAGATGPDDAMVAYLHGVVIGAMGSRRAQDDTAFLLQHQPRVHTVVDWEAVAHTPQELSSGQPLGVWNPAAATQRASLLPWLRAGDSAPQPKPPRRPAGLDSSANVSELAARLAHHMYTVAAAAQPEPSSYALFQLAECRLHRWSGVEQCMRQTSPQEGLQLHRQAADLHLAHSQVALAQYQSTGWAGVFQVPINLSLGCCWMKRWRRTTWRSGPCGPCGCTCGGVGGWWTSWAQASSKRTAVGVVTAAGVRWGACCRTRGAASCDGRLTTMWS